MIYIAIDEIDVNVLLPSILTNVPEYIESNVVGEERRSILRLGPLAKASGKLAEARQVAGSEGTSAELIAIS